MDELDVRVALVNARCLSTWGPDFSQTNVLDAWAKKLALLDPEAVIIAIEKLSGGKEFPSPNDILAAARPHAKKKVKGEHDDPSKELLLKIWRSEEMKRQRDEQLGDAHDIMDKIRKNIKLLPSGKCDMDLLEEYAKDIGKTILELHWRNHRWD